MAGLTPGRNRGVLREDTIMRHRRKGRKLGRNPNHQRALLRSLASALILTEREPEEDEENKPKVKGRIVTTIQKAKEVRPLVERVVTIAIRALPQVDAAARLEPHGERNSEEWKQWRAGPGWAEWNKAIAPVLAARRRTLQLLGSKQAVRILFDDIAPRFSDRPGGYTRVLRLAKPRLGDAGVRAILEFVGTHDRKRRKAARPAFEVAPPAFTDAAADVAADNIAEETPGADTPATEGSPTAETKAAE